VQVYQPITDVYFTLYIKSWNFAKRQSDSANDSGWPFSLSDSDPAVFALLQCTS